MNVKFESVVYELRSILDSIKNIWNIIFDLEVLEFNIEDDDEIDFDLIHDESEDESEIDWDYIETRITGEL